MLSNNTFWETRIQQLLDGLIFVEKGLGMHVQRMLKIKIYILNEILSKIFVKSEYWGPYLRSGFDKLTIWCQLIFLLKYIMRSLFA